MPTIEAVYEGDLHTEAIHAASGVRLTTDAPKDNEGRGESFSPTDLVATALGTCMLTIMGIAARRRGIAMEGTRVAVDKHMVADPDRRIGTLEVVFDLPAGLSDDERKILERAAVSCPVHRSLGDGIEIPVTFRYTLA